MYEQRKQSFMKFILLQNTSFAPVINVRPKVSLKSRKAAWRHASAMARAEAVACKARDKILTISTFRAPQ